MTDPNPSGIRANPVELKAWLLERHPVVSAVIASRFALRVLPFVVEPTEGSFSARQVRQIISAFRHAALGRLYIKRPSVGLRVVGIALNSVMPKTGDSAGAAVFEACVAAATAADAARSAALSSGPAHRASYAALWASHVDGGDYFWGPSRLNDRGSRRVMIRLTCWISPYGWTSVHRFWRLSLISRGGIRCAPLSFVRMKAGRSGRIGIRTG